MRAWRRRGWLACLLWPLSLLFGGLSRLRGALYRSGRLPVTRLPVPVIVVGNIYVGGTGKTPLVIWLVQKLRAAGYQPGVISRGYGAQASTPQLVGAAASVAAVGDEPLLLAERCGCPVMVGRKRPGAAQALLAAFPQIDVIVADDGLQHTALARDIEIVLFDERGVGNGWLLPAGPLREPAARRRDFTVLNVAQATAPARSGTIAETVAEMETPSESAATAAASAPIGVPAGMPIFHMQLVGVLAERLINRAQRMPLTPVLHVPAVAGRTAEAAVEPATAQPPEAEPQASRVVAAAGIGNPARFFSMLRATGLIFDEMPLPDHYPFVENPFAAELADIILITEKDAVKCSRHPTLKNDPRLWVVPVTAHIDDALAEHILEKLRGYPTA
jgi:tetraacyldisaccharide 4'-kinase